MELDNAPDLGLPAPLQLEPDHIAPRAIHAELEEAPSRIPRTISDRLGHTSEARTTAGSACLPKKSRGLFRQGDRSAFELIEAEKVRFPVVLMCRALDVSRAGLYADDAPPAAPGVGREVLPPRATFPPSVGQVPPCAPWTAPAIALLGLPLYGVPLNRRRPRRLVAPVADPAVHQLRPDRRLGHPLGEHDGLRAGGQGNEFERREDDRAGGSSCGRGSSFPPRIRAALRRRAQGEHARNETPRAAVHRGSAARSTHQWYRSPVPLHSRQVEYVSGQ